MSQNPKFIEKMPVTLLKESVQNSLLQMQEKERGAQARRVYVNTRGGEHRSDVLLRCSSRA